MYLVLKILFSSPLVYLPAKEIQFQLEEDYGFHLDIKTVRSIIVYINDFFYEMIHADLIEPVHKKGYRIASNLFSHSELQFLLDMIRAQVDLNFEDKQRLSSVFESMIPISQMDQFQITEIQQDHHNYSLLRSMQTIQKAIVEGRKIQFNYVSYDVVEGVLKEIKSLNGNDLNPANYVVSPYKIISSNNHYYLIAYNDKYQSIVNYRIDRMRLVLLKKNRYDTVPEDIDLENEINKTINMFSIDGIKSDIELEVYEQSVLREVVSRFEGNLPASKLYNGHYKVKISDVTINDGLKGWLMMMGTSIKVLAPQSLVEDQKYQILKMLEMY